MVAELTTSSPLTFDIYGFCANSILSEFFPHGDVEQLIVPGEGYMKTEDLHDEEELKPQNHLTGKQKLVLALSMAEALAVLHGYKDGLIVHDDVQLSQYLFNADKTVLKLNDFNRAEFLLFDEENQKYCLYKNGQGHGNVSRTLLYLSERVGAKDSFSTQANSTFESFMFFFPAPALFASFVVCYDIYIDSGEVRKSTKTSL